MMNKEEYFKELGRKKITRFTFEDIEKIETKDILLLLKYCPGLESIELPLETTYEQICLLKNFEKLSSVCVEFAMVLSRESFVKICDLPHLKHLVICNHKIDDYFFEDLSLCTNLESLSLPNCEYLLDDDLKTLTTLQSLKVLDLFGSFYLTQTGILSLKSFSNLIELGLGQCTGLNDESMTTVGELPKLEILDLGRTSISAAGFKAIARLKNLKILNLGFCKEVNDEGFNFLKDQTKLEQLHLNNCYKLSETAFNQLSDYKKLTHLDVSYTKFSNRNLREISSLSSLGGLNLRSCDSISSEGFEMIHELKNLVDLDVCFCEGIDDNVLLKISSLESLVTLDISRCNHVTDKGLACLSNHPHLTHINLTNCQGITEKGLSLLVKNSTVLKAIYLSKRNSISGLDIITFRAEHQHIEIHQSN